MELRESRSGSHAKMPSASPFAMRSSILSKIGLSGFLAVRFSIRISTICRSNFLTSSFSSVICASIDKICLSSTSIDLRAYRYILSYYHLYYWSKEATLRSHRKNRPFGRLFFHISQNGVSL